MRNTKEKAQSFLTGLYILVGCAGIEPTTNGLKVVINYCFYCYFTRLNSPILADTRHNCHV